MPYLTRDGVKLYYDEAGDGPAMVFVHGWCCNRGYFAPQAEYFSAQHRVISVDLRGHGDSDAPEGDYTMPVFADDVAWMCGELGVRRAIVVGHSMGGGVVGFMAARHPRLVVAAIAIDSAIVSSARFVTNIQPVLAELASPGYVEASRRMVEGMFEPSDDPERKARIIREMSSAPRHVMLGSMQGTVAGDAASIGRVTQPMLLISAGRFPVDLAKLREFAPKLKYGQTVGSGHFNQLEVPDQVNAMIRRFLATEVDPESSK